jgi:hypothetical protein
MGEDPRGDFFCHSYLEIRNSLSLEYDGYWSSTEDNGYFAVGVYFDNGGTFGRKNGDNLVACVHD